jgi:hypothetical protein
VRANNTGGDSGYSNTTSATTLPSIPVAPSSLTATATSSSQINLSWADNSNNETGFKIERCQGIGCTDFAQIATVAVGVTSYANTGLVAATTYQYRVRAYNTGGDSGYSSATSATTLPSPPAAPGNLTATAVSLNQINLTWADNSNNEDGFRIERCQGSTCTNFVQVAEVGPNVTNYSDSGLALLTTYRYRVYAYNSGGNSAFSNIASARTLLAQLIPLNENRVTLDSVSLSVYPGAHRLTVDMSIGGLVLLQTPTNKRSCWARNPLSFLDCLIV